MNKPHLLRFDNGDTETLYQLPDGRFACPICGDPWDEPPYCPVDGQLFPEREFSAAHFGSICPTCNVEFGVETGCAPYAPKGFMKRQFARFRTEYLDRVRWSRAALDQLQKNLGLSESRLREDATTLNNGAAE